jgi:hypothetical protein
MHTYIYTYKEASRNIYNIKEGSPRGPTPGRPLGRERGRQGGPMQGR